MSFDPRNLSKPVYQKLSELHDKNTSKAHKKEQKNAAVEIYTFLSTWGLMRLKAEEPLRKDGEKEVISKFFQILSKFSEIQELSTPKGLEKIEKLETDQYLGLMGLGLALAQEFTFWANAIYTDV